MKLRLLTLARAIVTLYCLGLAIAFSAVVWIGLDFSSHFHLISQRPALTIIGMGAYVLSALAYSIQFAIIGFLTTKKFTRTTVKKLAYTNVMPLLSAGLLLFIFPDKDGDNTFSFGMIAAAILQIVFLFVLHLILRNCNSSEKPTSESQAKPIAS